MFFWQIFNTTVCVAYIAWTVSALLRSQRMFYLHVCSLLLVLTNGLAIPFVGNFETLSDLHIDEVTVFRSCVSMWLFMAICVAVQLTPLYKRRMATPEQEPLSPLFNLFIAMACLVGLAAAYRFLIYGGAIRYLGDVFSNVASVESYYAERASLGLWLTSEKGKGVASAYIATQLIFPIAIAGACYAIVQQKKYIFILVIPLASLASGIIATIYAARLPLLVAMIYPLACLILLWKPERWERDFLKGRSLIFLGTITVGSMAVVIGVYYFTNKVGIIEALALAFHRIMVIPAETAGYYYGLFPDSLPFRGILRAFNMAPTASVLDDVSFEMVTYTATGQSFLACASILPIGYSGFGYFGVGLVSLSFCAICGLVDYFALQTTPARRMLAYICGPMGILSLVDTPMMNCCMAGLGLSPLIMLVITGPLRVIRYRGDKPVNTIAPVVVPDGDVLADPSPGGS